MRTRPLLGLWGLTASVEGAVERGREEYAREAEVRTCTSEKVEVDVDDLLELPCTTLRATSVGFRILTEELRYERLVV